MYSIATSATIGDMVLVGVLVLFSILLISPIQVLRSIALIPYTILSWLAGTSKKHETRWSVVYDSITGQPLDPAYVKVYDHFGTLIGAMNTDLNGRFNILLSQGTYRIEVAKTHYTFPSRHLLGKLHDRAYKGLYFGESFEVGEGEHGLAFSIPLDPVAADWNQEEKKRRNLFLHAGQEIISRALLAYLAVIAFCIFFRFPEKTLFVQSVAFFETALLLVWIARRAREHTLYHSVVLDQNRRPIPHARVTIFTAKTDLKMAVITTTLQGHFVALVPNGTYYVRIESHDTSESRTPFTSKPFVVASGAVARTFRV